MQPINIGDRIPSATVSKLEDGRPVAFDIHDLLRGRRVVLFALPGAFTPTCSAAHLPRFEELYDGFRDAGIDEIICVSVNDAFVMDAWGRAQGVDRVRLVADGNAELSRATGLLVDKSALGFGPRSWRYALVIDDGVVTHRFIEPDVPGDPFEQSDADTVLSTLAPGIGAQPNVTLIGRAGCGHCERARAALREAGLAFEEIKLDGALTSRSLKALSGAATTPQVFVDGERVGGADELATWLQHRRAA